MAKILIILINNKGILNVYNLLTVYRFKFKKD